MYLGYFIMYVCLQVIGLKIKECVNATSCNECLDNINLLCGWCVVEGKCSQRSFCQDSDISGRFLTQNSDSCISTVTIDPPQFYPSMPYQVLCYIRNRFPQCSLYLQIKITFSPAGPPPKLSGEEYFCVFNNISLNIEILSPLQVNGTSATCQVDNVISQVTDIQLGKVHH